MQDNIKQGQRGDRRQGRLHPRSRHAGDGLNEFVKHFYPQFDKKALIIDVRGNGGGNVSPMLIERLRREMAMIGIARNTHAAAPIPAAMIYGPKVCLMNEFSASDGDLFPYRFRHYKLGQADRQAQLGRRRRHPRHAAVAGRRLRSTGRSSRATTSRARSGSSRATASIRTSSSTTTRRRNTPATDQQLNKAIEVILEKLKTKEKDLPKLPPYPKK